MLHSLSRRLLTLLQLTRMALVFTAIADGLCTVLLSAQRRAAAQGTSLSAQLDARQVAAAAAISVGLYGFGMSLNDIIDRRRDSQISPQRPLPSGRVGLAAAHVVCVALIATAVLASVYYSNLARDGGTSVVLAIGTAALIAFYDLAGKYLVAPGLLTLGLIRMFHALVPDAHVPLLWHPLWLLNHVAILSTVAYGWEEKRPPLTRRHWWFVLGGLALIDGMFIAIVAARRGAGEVGMAAALRIELALLVPVLASVLFVFIAWRVRRKSASSRDAGQRVMLYGLLWLIVYDAAFVAGYVRNGVATLAVLMLLPVAYLSVQLMRWWSKLMAVSHRPAFKRART
jgi:4-hydroxybenzoate polyprenyltransferase